MRLIARTTLDNKEIAYMSDPQKIYEVKEKLYRYECVADEPENVVPIDRVLEIVEGEASDPDPEKDNEGLMYSEGWIECGLTIAEQIRALKDGGDVRDE